MPRPFSTLDVFTQTPLSGNPLAVVGDGAGLDTAAMQAIAREFNLSETVFVLPPEEPRHRARLRIFTPVLELPFAGHPTVGAAVFLALQDSRADRADAVAFGLETGIGVVPCVVEAGAGRGRARFKLPVHPDYRGAGPDASALADVLGLAPGEIGFARHSPSRHAAGPEFTFVPVASRASLDAARPGPALSALAEAVYLYTPDPEGLGLAYQARMFAPAHGIAEDPATGSAAAAFAGVLMQFEPLGDGTHDVAIRQGVAMGRASTIDLQITLAEGGLRSIEIGGGAVRVCEGTLHV